MDKNHDSKAQSNAAKVTADQNPVATPEAAVVPAENNNDVRQIRTPFTDLSQIDADLALARTLQEQVLLCVCMCVYMLGIHVKVCSFLFVCVSLGVLSIT